MERARAESYGVPLTQCAYGLRPSYALLNRTGLQWQSLLAFGHCLDFLWRSHLFRPICSENGHVFVRRRCKGIG